MPEEKNECRTGMPCGLPKSGNACMNRTTACCTRISAPRNRQSAGEPYFIGLMPQALRHETAAEGNPGFAPGARQAPSSPCAGDKKRVWNVRANGKRQRYPTRGIA